MLWKIYLVLAILLLLGYLTWSLLGLELTSGIRDPIPKARPAYSTTGGRGRGGYFGTGFGFGK